MLDGVFPFAYKVGFSVELAVSRALWTFFIVQEILLAYTVGASRLHNKHSKSYTLYIKI
jgi:hypothetical protein